MSEDYNNDNNKNEDPRFYMVEFYKKWHRSGFLSARYWPSAEKVQVEIGTTDPNTKQAVSVSKCFLKTFGLMSYLHAEVNGMMEITYPDFPREEWKVFGGTNGSGGDITSRVFTAGFWRPNKDAPTDTSKRGFRCGNYSGNIGKNGSIIPNFNEVYSFDIIQMKMEEIAEMYHSLNCVVNSYAVQRADQVVVFDE